MCGGGAGMAAAKQAARNGRHQPRQKGDGGGGRGVQPGSKCRWRRWGVRSGGVGWMWVRGCVVCVRVCRGGGGGGGGQELQLAHGRRPGTHAGEAVQCTEPVRLQLHSSPPLPTPCSKPCKGWQAACTLRMVFCIKQLALEASALEQLTPACDVGTMQRCPSAACAAAPSMLLPCRPHPPHPSLPLPASHPSLLLPAFPRPVSQPLLCTVCPVPPHMRTMSATGCTKILPSPISPVYAAAATSRTTTSTWFLQRGVCR